MDADDANSLESVRRCDSTGGGLDHMVPKGATGGGIVLSSSEAEYTALAET